MIRAVMLGGWVMLAFGGAVGMATAQEPPPRPLTFESAVAEALERNPVYLRQLNQVEASGYAARQSFGQMLPSLNAGISFDGSTSRARTAFDEWGQPLQEEEFREITGSSTSQGLSGSVRLFDLRAIRNHGAARARTDAQAAAAAQQAAVLRTQIGTEYFDAVLRAQLVGVEERGLRIARENLAAIRQLLRVAARQPTDVLGAELQVAQAEQSLQRARGAARKAELQLRARMGVPLDRDFDLTTPFPEVFDPAGLAVEALIDGALARSPRMTQQLAAENAARRGLAAARATRLPTLSGSYSWGRAASLPDYDAFGHFNPENRSWRFGVSIGVPVFNGFQTSADVGQARIDALNARETLRETRLDLEREVRAALIDLENAHADVQLAERSADIAREQLRQGQEQYRLNTLDYTALQRMVEQVAAAERNVLQAYYSFTTALLTLEERVGGPVEAGG